jgi:hypothetical protein
MIEILFKTRRNIHSYESRRLSICSLNVQGSFNKNGSVPTNAGILTGRFKPEEDCSIIGDFSEYIELEEVPLRYNPLYLTDLGNVCSPANLQKAGWRDASTCPFQKVAGVGGSNLNGNLEFVIPPTLDGMPFLRKLTVLGNPRQGFASMRIEFYDPAGYQYPVVVRLFYEFDALICFYFPVRCRSYVHLS